MEKENVAPPTGGGQPDDPLPPVARLTSPPQRPWVTYFGDEYSAVWAAVTTAVCGAWILGSNLMFVAAALGAPAQGALAVGWAPLSVSALIVALLAAAALFFGLRAAV